ncbi:MAG: xylulokinase [bacterium]
MKDRAEAIVLAVDLGTTALKAVLADQAGRTLASASAGYPTFGGREGFAEQDPAGWWSAFVNACRALKREEPRAFGSVALVAMCGQMHTHVYLDESHRPLRSAISWMDQRSAPIVEELKGDADAAATIKEETANAVTATYTAPNLLWVQRNDPATWERTRAILVAKDYVKFLLTGEMTTDPSEAAGTLLFNVAEGRWSRPLLDLFRVDEAMLPQVAPAAHVIGHVTPGAAEQTALPAGTPVVNGATDNSTAALGAGVTESGEATAIIGTAGVISVCSDHPIPDPNDAVVCWNYALANRWINLGVMQTAGESLNWFRRAFDANSAEEKDIFSQYNAMVADVPEGAEGLFFLPYLNGERSPYWDGDARGVFFGAGLGTTKAHFVRAIMEGVAMALRNNAETVEALGQQITEIRAVGGGLKSRAWLQILSAIMEKPIRVIHGGEPSVRGNVALGMSAIGELGDPAELAKAGEESSSEILEPAREDRFDEHYALFLDLYTQLQPLFKRRAALVHRATEPGAPTKGTHTPSKEGNP